MVEDLPVGYYLDNFRYLLDFVSRRYDDLLSAEESRWAAGFHDLSLDARRLYVRLLSRKGPLFRNDRLNYHEIGDLHAAAADLKEAGYADECPDATPEALLSLFRRHELQGLSREFRRTDTRAAMLDCLVESVDVAALRRSMPFRVIRPLGTAEYRVFRLLFFGNLRQDLTEFVLRDLGVSPYETYPIHPQDRFFDERSVLEDALAIHDIGEESIEAVEANDVAWMSAFAVHMPMVKQARLKRRIGRIYNRVARQLERLDHDELALDLYCRTHAAPSRERRARILARRDDVHGAIGLCCQIINDPEDEAEYEFGVSFGRRLARRNQVELIDWPPPGTNEFVSRSIAVPADPGLRVEELARRWFEHDPAGARAFYVENGLLPSLFGLAFWDIIFHPVKGVFFNPFQRGPDDLFTADFRDCRQAMIEARYEELEAPGELVRRVRRTFSEKYPIANHFVHWGAITEELLSISLVRIPVSHLLAVFRRLLRDLRHNRAGFPDLVVFPEEGGYLLAEVKGPGDTLQNNQKRWLRYFNLVGIPAEVVNVEWK